MAVPGHPELGRLAPNLGGYRDPALGIKSYRQLLHDGAWAMKHGFYA